MTADRTATSVSEDSPAAASATASDCKLAGSACVAARRAPRVAPDATSAAATETAASSKLPDEGEGVTEVTEMEPPSTSRKLARPRSSARCWEAPNAVLV